MCRGEEFNAERTASKDREQLDKAQTRHGQLPVTMSAFDPLERQNASQDSVDTLHYRLCMANKTITATISTKKLACEPHESCSFATVFSPPAVSLRCDSLPPMMQSQRRSHTNQESTMSTHFDALVIRILYLQRIGTRRQCRSRARKVQNGPVSTL